MRELLVLWDVDHTLLNAGGLSSHLYGLVFAELFGRPRRCSAACTLRP